jgi:hypothetical protein
VKAVSTRFGRALSRQISCDSPAASVAVVHVLALRQEQAQAHVISHPLITNISLTHSLPQPYRPNDSRS